MANTITRNDPDTNAQAGLNVSAAHLISPASGLAVELTNQEAAVLASAARTTTQTQGDQTNTVWRGIIVVLDVTNVAASPSITLEIDGKDPASGKYYAILTGAAVTTNSTNVYRVYPGLTASANATANDALPKTWRIKIIANNSNSATYSVGAMLIL